MAEALLNSQLATGELIGQVWRNTTKLGMNNCTTDILQTKLELLEMYWIDYVKGHQRLFSYRNALQQEEYFTQDLYSEVEEIYIDTKVKLKAHLSSAFTIKGHAACLSSRQHHVIRRTDSVPQPQPQSPAVEPSTSKPASDMQLDVPATPAQCCSNTVGTTTWLPFTPEVLCSSFGECPQIPSFTDHSATSSFIEEIPAPPLREAPLHNSFAGAGADVTATSPGIATLIRKLTTDSALFFGFSAAVQPARAMGRIYSSSTSPAVQKGWKSEATPVSSLLTAAEAERNLERRHRPMSCHGGRPPIRNVPRIDDRRHDPVWQPIRWKTTPHRYYRASEAVDAADTAHSQARCLITPLHRFKTRSTTTDEEQPWRAAQPASFQLYIY